MNNTRNVLYIICSIGYLLRNNIHSYMNINLSMIIEIYSWISILYQINFNLQPMNNYWDFVIVYSNSQMILWNIIPNVDPIHMLDIHLLNKYLINISYPIINMLLN